MERYLVNPPELKDARAIGYNHAIVANGEFTMAGQVAMDSEGEIVGDDIRTQAERAYENVGILLSAVGKGFADVTKVTTHIVDLSTHYFDGYKDVYWEAFSEPYPCHTVLGAHQLAHEGYLVEVEVEVPFTDRDVAAIEPDGETVVRVP
ncbi:RidA family protein [Natronorarus salvus]|uniref:RidA family protein n=1 Tax=Natronorarus salvus TaxID=3117733 RepID=UPI002F260026